MVAIGVQYHAATRDGSGDRVRVGAGKGCHTGRRRDRSVVAAVVVHGTSRRCNLECVGGHRIGHFVLLRPLRAETIAVCVCVCECVCKGVERKGSQAGRENKEKR